MEIESLKLRGAIGIMRGMGLEEVSLDFSGLSGLVAFSGPCGRGKTTILENMQPYRTLVSRKQKLQDHFYLRDSFRELSFRMAGDHYRSLIRIDAKSGRSEGFLYRNHATESMVNGKLGEYDKAVTDLFGTDELFFNSVFCAQNSAKLSDMKTSALKSLMSEFLRLDRYIRDEKTSSQCESIINGRIMRLDQDIEIAGKTISAILVTPETVAAMESGIHTDEAEIVATRDSITVTERCIADQEQKAIGRERIIKEIERIHADIKTAEDEIEGYRSQMDIETLAAIANAKQGIESDMAAIRADIGKYTTEKESELATIRVSAQAALAAIKEVSALLLQEEEIKKAVNEEKKVIEERDKMTMAMAEKTQKRSVLVDQRTEKQSRIEAHRLEWEKAKAKHDDIVRNGNELVKKCVRDLDQLQKDLSAADSDTRLGKLQTERSFSVQQTVALEKRSPNCTDDSCLFIRNAVLAKGDISRLDIEIAQRKKELAEVRAEIVTRITTREQEKLEFEDDVKRYNTLKADACAENISKVRELSKAFDTIQAEITGVISEIANINKRLSQIPAELATLHALSQRAYEIRGAKEKLSTYTAEKADLVEKGMTISARWDSMISGKQAILSQKMEQLLSIETDLAVLQDIKDRWNRMIAGKEEQVSTLRRQGMELSLSIETNPTDEIDRLVAEVATLKNNLRVIESGIAEKKAAHIKAREDLATKARMQAELNAKQAERNAMAREASEWAYIKNACGKDGLRALEIDSVAPAIASYANNLLHSAFGTQESLEIQTQDETGKEVLDIIVHTADGNRVPIEMFSGGQKVWLLKAARLALTMISKERSGRAILTCLADEEDGSLDAESAKMFISLYRTFAQQGGFNTNFFISHKPECVAMADSQVVFNSNGITIRN